VGTAAQRAAAHRAGIHAKSACKLVKPQDAQLRVPTSRAACCFALPPGQAADGSEGRRPLRAWPAAPPKANRLTAWEHGRELHRRRNAVEHLFRRLKAHRRSFCRCGQLDGVMIPYLLTPFSNIFP